MGGDQAVSAEMLGLRRLGRRPEKGPPQKGPRADSPCGRERLFVAKARAWHKGLPKNSSCKIRRTAVRVQGARREHSGAM